MKWFKNIVFLSLLWLLCGAPSCSDESPRDKYENHLLAASVDSIKKAFDVDIPGELLLKGYEINAVQKLIDFADFLKIAADTSMDTGIRNQAADMAGKLFISTDVDTRNWCKSYHASTLNTLEQLLSGTSSQRLPFWLKPVHINIYSHFRQENDSTFRGSLSFYLQSFNYNNPGKLVNQSGNCVIDIYALRKVKLFGEKRLSVWEVCLGDVY